MPQKPGITLKQIIRSHIWPYKHYSDDNKLVGTYVMHMPDGFAGRPYFNIKFTPIEGTVVKNATAASIQISDKYQANVWMMFRGVQIDVPYKTDPSEIEAIVDKYLETWEQLVTHNSHCIAADYSD